MEAAIINLIDGAARFLGRGAIVDVSRITMTQQPPQARYFALIPAAGVGARMGAACPKQYLPIAGKPMLRHVVDVFLSHPTMTHTFVVVSENDAYIDDVIPAILPHVTVLRCGGGTRKESVLNGLQAMCAHVDDDDWILVHDAARPGLTARLIEKLTTEVGDDKVGGLLALPVVDTVKRVGAKGVDTLSREGLWLAQTPQMFRSVLLLRALMEVTDVTDDASAVEALGLSPKLVEGDVCNLKVTLPSDIRIVEMFLER